MRDTLHIPPHQLTHQVADELSWSADVDADQVDVTSRAAVVTLSGQVRTLPARAAAVRAALRVRGVSAVVDRLSVGTASASRADAHLEQEATAALALTDGLGSSVHAGAAEGVITLTGDVPWHFRRTEAEHAVATLAGITGVVNAITLAPTLAFVPLEAVALVTAALRRSAAVDADNVHVTTTGSTVELFGHVPSSAQREEAGDAAWSAPGVTHVANNLRVLDFGTPRMTALEAAGRADASLCAVQPATGRMRTRLYRGGALVREGFPVSETSGHLRQEGATVWLDLHDPSAADLQVLDVELGLHPLAVEDALARHERPKIDRYPDHLFLSAYSVHLDPATSGLVSSELAAFVTPRALVTVRKDDGFDVDALVQRWDDNPDLAVHGVGYLLHGLLDVVVDSHFAAVQSLDDEIEELQELLFAEQGTGTEVQRRSFRLRKSLVLLRRVVLPMREVVNTLMRRDPHLVDEEMTHYFQDVYDHVLRATEWTESLRDLVTTILETRLSLQGNRLNEIMKKLTGWAAIIAIPTAVTGFYGQNVPYPGSGEPWGVLASTVIVLVLSGGLFAAFRRRGWL